MNSRVMIPAATMLIAALFLYLGLVEFGFWNEINGPLPGFFPSLASILLIIISAFALKGAWGSEAPKFFGIELMVIAGCIGIMLLTFLIGLIPSVVVYLVVWLRIVEKTPWISTVKVAGFMTVLVIGVFVLWLKIPFPTGLIGNLF
ncbi:MAG TPA: tripartite tricarboxylate transporter TctB family protein [Clostridiaceae bacterium]|nr:tripartite tricarboxylate transporter TctB family protein [Clostridiaceae bacterium]